MRPQRARLRWRIYRNELSCCSRTAEDSLLEHLELSVRNLNYVQFKLKETFTVLYNKESKGDRVPGPSWGLTLSGTKRKDFLPDHPCLHPQYVLPLAFLASQALLPILKLQSCTAPNSGAGLLIRSAPSHPTPLQAVLRSSVEAGGQHACTSRAAVHTRQAWT